LQCAHQLKRDGYATKIIHHAHRIGKSAANNHAARFAKGDLLLSLDDDTHLSTPYEAAHLASAFADKNVAAASGNLKIANSSASLWTSLQSLEYLASITAGRSFLNIIDAIACCSGAFSMFDRTIFLKIGGLNVGPGEDLEITQRLRLLGYTTRFVRHAEAMTQAPVTLARLIHQRVRWDRDALNIRLLMYKQLMAQSTHESLGDTLQRLDFVIFELVPTFFFPFYCIYIIYFFQSEALNFLYGLYILLLGLYTLNIAIVIITTRAQLAFFDALTIFILPLYQGVFMRFVQIYAFADELFFQGSHRDTYVPKYIRTALYQKVNYAQD